MAGRVIQGFFGSVPANAAARWAQLKPAENQLLAHPGGAFPIDPARLGLANFGGRPLSDAVRGRMEAAFGMDFSAVRVHIGPQAERLGAYAFTSGTDIYFAPGRYQPDSLPGRQLLGHELAHVVQQKQGRVRVLAGGLAVVVDPALETEAARLGERAAVYVPAPASLQPQPNRFMSAGSSAGRPSVQSKPVRSGFPPVARFHRMGAPGAGGVQPKLAGVPQAIQAMEASFERVEPQGGRAAKLLKKLAAPKILKGPEVEAQQRIVAVLDDLIESGQYPLQRGGFGKVPLGVICLGGIQLPEDLPVSRSGLVDKEKLIRSVELTEMPNPVVDQRFDLIAGNEGIKQDIVRNTISTMIQAGQIRYLHESGMTRGEWTIWIEIHYFHSRPKTQYQFHKDTRGDTLFVNLNYITDQEIAGPEWVENPPLIAGHEEQIRASLPGGFQGHLAWVRNRLSKPKEIKVGVIPAHGAVAFADELIHHSTPMPGHRDVFRYKVLDFLKAKFPEGSKELAKREKRLAQYEQERFTRKDLRKIGLKKKQVAELIDESNPGFAQVEIPNPEAGPDYPITGPIRDEKGRLLKRQVSQGALRGVHEPQGDFRRFFRTWVRAMRKT